MFKNKNDMNIVGEGWKIMLFTIPSIVLAIFIHLRFSEFVMLPSYFSLIGFVLLFFGVILWGTAVVQLLICFPKGKLVVSGAYSLVRNPIYSSATFFLIPAVSLILSTWVYFIVSVFLYIGVVLFIKNEERMLLKTFGKEYETYMKRVHRMIPFV